MHRYFYYFINFVTSNPHNILYIVHASNVISHFMLHLCKVKVIAHNTFEFIDRMHFDISVRKCAPSMYLCVYGCMQE